ncbi:hypothetical protein [Thiohalocapsa sp. ML1]|jgi:hypothetical protein|uniref:hypothetical protein n=1 Tax=Thiohalocapsa sp. ML1 TaxID=1431688 RepID=UPI000731F5C8|nr:hypothetical protein [Thiohalocapsa sp. ML1]
MRASRPVPSALIALLAALGLGGCANETKEQVDFNLLFTNVEPIEYARILCRGIEMQDQHTCMTSVIKHYSDTRYDDFTPSQITGGPFVVVLDDDLYRGTYVSQPFAAAFTVSNGYNLCRGRYNAFAGDTKARFAVRCDDGSSGTAKLILDVDGRNGIGKLEFYDGREGDIVFGYRAVGGNFL